MTTITETARWIARLLQTTDSFHPAGACAHSFGLEGLVQAGAVCDRPSLRAFLLEHALPQLAHTDLPVVARAWTAAGDPPDWLQLCGLCRLGATLHGAPEPREDSEASGRQHLDLAARLHGGIATEFNRRAAAEGWPRPLSVAAAVAGRALGAPQDAVLSAFVYATAADLIAAAMKLLRLGPHANQSLLAEALSKTPTLIAAALTVELDAIGSFNPWWDIAAAHDETAGLRLFTSSCRTQLARTAAFFVLGEA